jgi:hypothetical protein
MTRCAQAGFGVQSGVVVTMPSTNLTKTALDEARLLRAKAHWADIRRDNHRLAMLGVRGNRMAVM